MNLGDSALTAFQAAAGIAPDKMSLYIRMALLALTFVWAAWCVLGKIHHFHHHDGEIFDLFRQISRILVIVVFMTVLVFI